jgi:biopolymer transport protein ExbB
VGARVNTLASLVDRAALALTSAFAEGGFVALPLMGIALVLAFALGERAFVLRRGTRLSLAALVDTMWAAGDRGAPEEAARQEVLARPREAAPSVLAIAIACLEQANALTAHVPSERRAHALRLSLAPLDDVLHRHAVLVRTLVVIAPLLGLLGTVSGMIETFDSLASMTLHSGGNGGVAGGISEALVSTELGLLVAIPGLLIGRLLDRTERTRKDELGALADLTLLRGASASPKPTGGA